MLFICPWEIWMKNYINQVKLKFVIDGWIISRENSIKWLSFDFTGHTSNLLVVLAITWANVDPNVCCQIASLRHTDQKEWKLHWNRHTNCHRLICLNIQVHMHNYFNGVFAHRVSGELFNLTLNVRGPSYLGLTRSISCLRMPWLLTSPGHQQPWHWLCRICGSWSYLLKDVKYMCHINVE